MSKCKHYKEPRCLLNIYKEPTEKQCAECKWYMGDTRGAGDVVHKVAKAVGADKVAKVVESVTGKDCGCGKRRAKLNEMFPKKDGRDD